MPRLRGTAESGPWFALVAEDAAGRRPELPWRDGELDAVLAALDQVAGALTPAPVAVPAISEYLGTDFTGWRALSQAPADDRVDRGRAPPPELAALEATWTAHAAGETLLHGDIRADNLLIASGSVMVVDWPHACRGAAFTDLVSLRPERRDAGRPRACGAAREVPRGAGRQPGRTRGRRLRARGVLHGTLAAATSARTTDGAPLPGRARRGRPPMAGHPAVSWQDHRDDQTGVGTGSQNPRTTAHQDRAAVIPDQ